MTFSRVDISVSRLVTDCQGVLAGTRILVFSGTGRGTPSRYVYMFPNFELGYAYDLWETVVGPTLTGVSGSKPPDGWTSAKGQYYLEAHLRSALLNSPWANKLSP